MTTASDTAYPAIGCAHTLPIAILTSASATVLLIHTGVPRDDVPRCTSSPSFSWFATSYRATTSLPSFCSISARVSFRCDPRATMIVRFPPHPASTNCSSSTGRILYAGVGRVQSSTRITPRFPGFASPLTVALPIGSRSALSAAARSSAALGSPTCG